MDNLSKSQLCSMYKGLTYQENRPLLFNKSTKQNLIDTIKIIQKLKFRKFLN